VLGGAARVFDWAAQCRQNPACDIPCIGDCLNGGILLKDAKHIFVFFPEVLQFYRSSTVAVNL
jgi:hypothetical protein